MKAFLAMPVIVSLGVAVHAQPQAPIEWGAYRFLPADCPRPWFSTADVYCHGDTLVETAVYTDSVYYTSYPAMRISGDNGQTWSLWQVLGRVGPYDHGIAHNVGFNSRAIFCTAPTQQSYWGFYTTTDLGQTWRFPTDSLPVLRFYCQREDTLFCKTGLGVTWTADEGHTFAPVRNTGLEISVNGLAASNESVHAFTWMRGPHPLQQVRYTRAPLYDGAFEPTRILNEQVFWTVEAVLTFAEDGTGMLVSCVDYAPPTNNGEAVWLNITRDDGLTWTAPDTITPLESSGPSIGLVRNEHCWLASWYDTTRAPGFTNAGIWCRFSANHGRSWYPNQQVEGAGWTGVIGHAELRPGRARIYAALQMWDGVEDNYYFQWEGQIRTDSLAPTILSATLLRDSQGGGREATFSASATDDDSLWNMAVVLRRAGTADSVIVTLERLAASDYAAAWYIPPDTTVWEYYYRAEDMWENVSYYPPEGPAAPWTFHIGPLLASADFIPHPSSFPFSLSLSTAARISSSRCRPLSAYR